MLVNLGGPQNPGEVEDFLVDLLTDPYMIDTILPGWMQQKLFSWIAKRRAPVVAKKYAAMGFGGGSPLVDETRKQALALQKLLIKKSPKHNWQVDIAMTCGNPNIRDLSPDKLIPGKNNIIIPLYPQFSRSTTMSFARLSQKFTGQCMLSSMYVLSDFYQQDGYIQSICSLIMDFLNQKTRSGFFIKPDSFKSRLPENTTLLFSAHGIPMRLIKKGDRYQKAIEDNARLFKNCLRKMGFNGPIELSYQSRLGRSQWTSPSTIEKLDQLGKNGCKSICIYPISFVSDHLETLEEIDIELRQTAFQAGIENFIRIPAPGIWPSFIEFLTNTVLDLKQSNHDRKQKCVCLVLGGEKSQFCTL